MRFAAPEWFILLPILVIAGWYWKRLRLWQPLRVLALLLVVLILAEPQFRLLKDGIDLWVLVDRSESAADVVDQNIDEWKRLLEHSKPSRADRLHYVEYADEVVSQPVTESALFPGNRSLTRTRLALENTLAMTDPEKPARLLIFTDGFSTEPLTGLAEKLQKRGVPLDYRMLREEEEQDFRLSSFSMPETSQIGEPFVMEIQVAGNAEGEVPAIITRNGEQLLETSIQVSQGSGAIRLTDRIVEPGSHLYEVRIQPETDAYPGNNRYEAWIEISGGPRVLLVTKYTNDPVASVLRAQGFTVEVVTEPLSLQPGRLTGVKSVLFNNVPAYEVPGEFLEALNFFVSEQGGGFLMAGGKKSFGSGGYFDSPVDPLLPVSMELKAEHRKLAVAMAIVMDRSGSMSMTVPGGQTKIQLANEGASRAIELLGYQDLITVYAVDSEAHEIAPLLNVAQHRNELLRRVRSIESMGGGIFVYTGLEAAWKSLQKATVGQRHIILFSDAMDSEEPGDYKKLVKDITENSGSVSVIGLGTRSDVDSAFLEDIASRGNGRMFFTQHPGNLPNIFAQETVTVARSAFVEEPVGTKATGSWYEVSGSDLDWLPQADGYNLSYLRPDDSQALITTDEYAAPLIAYGHRGIGHTAAISFPLGGEFSESARQWEKLGDFLQTMNRWLMGEPVPPGIGLRSHLTGTELNVDLLYDDTWTEKFASRPPRVALTEGLNNPAVKELTWSRLAPGHYRLTTDLKEGQMVRGAVQVGGSALTFGPLVVGTSAEWAFDLERAEELRQTAAASGGQELLDLASAWRKPSVRDFTGIENWLFAALLAVILVEALVTRMGWRLPVLQLEKRQARQNTAKSVQRETPSPTKADAPAEKTAAQEKAPPKVSAEAAEKEAEKAAKERQSRFARAKRRR